MGEGENNIILYNLTFIEKVHEHGDVYSFHFKRPANLGFKAGQHGIFVQPAFTRPHPFSLSSAPEEFRELVLNQPTSSQYYLSGSPAFIKSTKELLASRSVNKNNIVTDSFLGY